MYAAYRLCFRALNVKLLTDIKYFLKPSVELVDFTFVNVFSKSQPAIYCILHINMAKITKKECSSVCYMQCHDFYLIHHMKFILLRFIGSKEAEFCVYFKNIVKNIFVQFSENARKPFFWGKPLLHCNFFRDVLSPR
jgi:hypothetical protein